MAKMFQYGLGSETVEREFRISKAVYDAGIPCPKPIRLVTDGEHFGAEYEVIANKRSFTRIISQEPEQLEPLTLKFAQLGRQLHSIPANTDVFPDMKDVIPSPKTCLHGDFHIGNIITNGEKDYSDRILQRVGEAITKKMRIK